MLPARDSQTEALWPLGDEVMHVLSQPDAYALDATAIAPLLAQCGFFRGSLLLDVERLRTTSPATADGRLVRQCLLLALCSDDVGSFELCTDALLVSAHTPLTERVQLWKFILTHVYAMQMDAAADRIAPQRLSTRLLLSHLLCSIDAQLAVTLLLSEPAYTDLCERANLPASFYSSVLEHAVLHCQQMTQNHALLESIDAYLWSDRPRTLPFNIAAAYEAECSSSQDGTNAARDADATAPRLLDAFATVRPSLDGSSAAASSSTFSSAFSRRGSRRPSTLFASAALDGSASGGAQKASSAAGVELLVDYHADESQLPASLLLASHEDLSVQAAWGMRVELQGARCAECALELSGPIQQLQQPQQPQQLLLFRCGHVVHQKCSSAARGCGQCYELAQNASSASRTK